MSLSGTKILDFRGEECPQPLYKAVREIASSKPGETIEILTDSEQCVDLISTAVEATGAGSVHLVRENGYIRMVIKRM